MKTWDLHCHTNASDGEMSPAALWQRAIDNNIDYLAITDHDTISGVRSLARSLSQNVEPDALVANGDILSADVPASGQLCRGKVSTPQGPELIAGVEITALDEQDVVVHIVGLWVDIENKDLLEFLDSQQRARSHRAQVISDRLEKAGLPPTFEGAKRQAAGSPLGRPHFARYLTELGLVPDMGYAFKHWLGRGKVGDVDIEWPSVQEVVETIHRADGLAVLAHPSKYKSGFGKCYELCQRFKEAGGDAVEVVSGAQPQKVTRDLERIADRLGLSASTGSDFHSPSQTWCDLGGQAALPEKLPAVWTLRESA